jgi:hypothetical protein
MWLLHGARGRLATAQSADQGGKKREQDEQSTRHGDVQEGASPRSFGAPY